MSALMNAIGCPEAYLSSRWYAVFLVARHEKHVARYLQSLGIEHFLPLYRAHRRWKDGSKVVLDLPLFPSYLFVRIDFAARCRVLAMPSVIGMVNGVGNKPAHIPDDQIEALRRGLSNRQAEPHPLLVMGQKVRIKSGPLSGQEGILRRFGNNCKVVLTLNLIMRSVAVEVTADELDVFTTAC